MALDEPTPYDQANAYDDTGSGQPPASMAEVDAPLQPSRWKLNLGLFLVTVVSVLFTAAFRPGEARAPIHGIGDVLRALAGAWTFAVPLLAILLTHEFGHYIAARVHRVEASLPFFIPLPYFSPFGTMGAVISMPGRIRSRNALLDIGASGPLAGLLVAIPVLIVGLMQSKVEPMAEHGTMEGQSLLYLLIKRIVLGPIPDGYDVYLSPTAFAGWGGLLVTMLNLVPIAQLDGGHIAYALLGPRQNRVTQVLHKSLLVLFALNLVRFAIPIVQHREWGRIFEPFFNSLSWLVWYALLHLVMSLGGRDHPPTEPGELSPLRKVLAVVCLALFVLLFMPTPLSTY
jgi:membrane-associated protease RseP (regulator of RpoE activity)